MSTYTETGARSQERLRVETHDCKISILHVLLLLLFIKDRFAYVYVTVVRIEILTFICRRLNWIHKMTWHFITWDYTITE